MEKKLFFLLIFQKLRISSDKLSCVSVTAKDRTRNIFDTLAKTHLQLHRKLTSCVPLFVTKLSEMRHTALDQNLI